jgi:single-stranded-DNA-specific exonuclease
LNVTTASPHWVLHPCHDLERARALAREIDAPVAVASVLVNRGLDDLDAVRRFLEPSLDDLNDPGTLLDLEPAVARIIAALERGEPVRVFGDYDVDGITSTFLLHEVLVALGARADYRIPKRTIDGYGLSRRAVDEAHADGVRLIVTVDCGVTAVREVAHATSLGIDVVVTDHHKVPEELPAAVAVVNPQRAGCAYPFKSLAGVGVTFKLVQALLRGRGGLARAKDWLDVVALGTIADVVPLVGENRVLARIGLDHLNQGGRIGLKVLAEVAGLAGRRITSGQVAFVLAPRINAAGRMDKPEEGVRLLRAKDRREATECARNLEENNGERRALDKSALDEAVRQVERELGEEDRASIVLWSDEWHAGVIGIVASRLVDRYRRPTLLVKMQDGEGRGSGRSLPGLKLNELLAECQDLLKGWGGHEVAAGFTVERGRLEALRERFEAKVREQLTAGRTDHLARYELDGELTFGECDLRLVEWLDRLSPHGLENPEPLFRTRCVEVLEAREVGSGKHLRLKVSDGTGTVEAIGFGFGPMADAVRRSGVVDLLYVPARNEWLGETRVQLKLKDVRLP